MSEEYRPENVGTGPFTINPSYAAGQLAKALTKSVEHPDADTRERALLKATKWSEALNGLLSGKIDVGSRQPLPDVPVWATLELVTGGFATGALLAGGTLRDHEKVLLADRNVETDSDARRLLNGYFLSEAGLEHLQALLSSTRYEIEVPEEGALLVVAWLTQHGHHEDARDLLDTLAPHFTQLRFYPIPIESPRRYGSRAHLQAVKDVIAILKEVTPKQRILAQTENIESGRRSTIGWSSSFWKRLTGHRRFVESEWAENRCGTQKAALPLRAAGPANATQTTGRSVRAHCSTSTANCGSNTRVAPGRNVLNVALRNCALTCSKRQQILHL